MIAKLGVKLDTLRPELAILEPIVDEVYESFGLQAIVTSTNDSKHKVGSLHYKDAAFDLRVHLLHGVEFQTELWQALKAAIETKYPNLYDVLLEDAGGPSSHIHCEAGPKLVATMDLEGK